LTVNKLNSNFLVNFENFFKRKSNMAMLPNEELDSFLKKVEEIGEKRMF